MSNTVMLNELLHTFKKQLAVNNAYKAKKADEYVISTIDGAASGLKILDSISATKHSYNFSGLGATATGFTKEKALELIKKWKLKEIFPNVKPVKKSVFVKEQIATLEKGIEAIEQALKAEASKGTPDTSSVLATLSELISDKTQDISCGGNNVFAKANGSVMVSHKSGSTISIDENGNVSIDGGTVNITPSKNVEETQATLAPAGVILASAVSNIRNGHSLTTYELAPIVKRLAHADISTDEIAERFSKAFADILLRQD